MVFYNYFLHTLFFSLFSLRIMCPIRESLKGNHLAKKKMKSTAPPSFSNREWVMWDEIPTMVEIAIFSISLMA